MNNKERYRKFCETEKTIPIFSKDWWLDAVCVNGEWDVALVEKGGEIFASMPYYLTKKKNFSIVSLPALTQTLGVWIKYPPGQKCATQLSHEKKVINELIEQLPRFDYFNQNFFYSLTNWLPFCWHGFQQTTRYTYRLDLSKSVEEIEENLDQHNRNAIKKGVASLEVEECKDIESLYCLACKTFARQNKKVPFEKEYLIRVFDAALAKSSGMVYIAKFGNIPVAGGLFIADAGAMYYLVGGFDGEYLSLRPMNFLLWHAIKQAKNRGVNWFDFEGSMIEGVEGFFRSFGAVQTPYFNISKIPSRILRAYKSLRDIIR